MRYPIIIAGLPRSGTSNIARILNTHFGVRTTRHETSGDINHEGFYEDPRLAKACNDLANGRITYDDWCIAFDEFVEDMQKYGTWGIKEPRLFEHLIPYVLKRFPESLVIRCRRNRELTIKSMIEKLGWKEKTATKRFDRVNRIMDLILKDRMYIDINYGTGIIPDNIIIDCLEKVELVNG